MDHTCPQATATPSGSSSSSCGRSASNAGTAMKRMLPCAPSIGMLGRSGDPMDCTVDLTHPGSDPRHLGLTSKAPLSLCTLLQMRSRPTKMSKSCSPSQTTIGTWIPTFLSHLWFVKKDLHAQPLRHRRLFSSETLGLVAASGVTEVRRRAVSTLRRGALSTGLGWLPLVQRSRTNRLGWLPQRYGYSLECLDWSRSQIDWGVFVIERY